MIIDEQTPSPAPRADAQSPAGDGPRADACAVYTPPRLERLGVWRALTLQQSVPIGPGGFLIDAGDSERLG